MYYYSKHIYDYRQWHVFRNTYAVSCGIYSSMTIYTYTETYNQSLPKATIVVTAVYSYFGTKLIGTDKYYVISWMQY